jgi:translation initiation factor 1
VSDNKVVWADGQGDLRKKSGKGATSSSSVEESKLILNVRRLTSGKGRTVIEVSGLPNNKKWCQDLAKDLKKSLGVGGTYKNSYIEIHGEKINLVTDVLDKRSLKWKKTGG